MGGSLYRGETKRTFHQFLVDHLIQVLSRRWYETESERPQEEWHPILRWIRGSEQYLNAATSKAIYGQIHGFHPDGNGLALLTLADDVYQLAHIMKTQISPFSSVFGIDVTFRAHDMRYSPLACWPVVAMKLTSWRKRPKKLPIFLRPGMLTRCL